MKIFAELGAKLKSFYGQWSLYLDIGGRFLAALLVFFSIRRVMPFQALFSNGLLLFALSVLCSVLNFHMIAVLAGILIAGQAFGLGIDAGITALAVILIVLLLFLRFVPDDSAAAVFMPLCMSFGFPILVPICCGLKRRPASLFAVWSGIAAAYLIRGMGEAAEPLRELPASDYAARLKLLVTSLFPKEMVLVLLASAAVVVAVYTVRKMSFAGAFPASVIAGAIIYIIFMIMGNSSMGTEVNLAAAAFGAAASAVAALLFLLLFLQLDYKKSQLLRFEDEEYYYYVKAVPKVVPVSEEYDEYEDSDEDEPDEDDLTDDVPDGVDYEKKLEESLKDL